VRISAGRAPSGIDLALESVEERCAGSTPSPPTSPPRDARIDELIAPFIDAVDKFDEIPGIGHRSAQELVAEIAVTMTVFPTAAHLVSWAKSAPIDNSPPAAPMPPPPAKATRGSPAPSMRSSPGTPTPSSATATAWPAAAARKRAIVAVGNSILTIIWHVLSDSGTRYHDLGPSYHDARITQQRCQRELTRQLEHLTGKRIAFQPRPDLPVAG
jgi:transposase